MKLLLIFITILNLHAFVDIKPVIIGEEQGLSGEIALDGLYATGNTEKKSYATSGELLQDKSSSF